MKTKRWLIGVLVLLMAWLGSSLAQTKPDDSVQAASAYEVDGRIELRLFHPNGNVWKDFKGDFRVFVNGSGWLIQENEVDDFGTPIRREIGTTNGTDLFEMVIPYQKILNPPINETIGLVVDANTVVPLSDGQIESMAFATTNAIPVGWLDSSFVGHLWLMYASGCYFRTAVPGQLTPVFDYRACAALDPSMKIKADWELLHGLPSKVNYYEQGDKPTAVYTVAAWTNSGTVSVPSKVHFEQPTQRYKVVDMEVTAVRSGCSRSDLLPTLKGKLLVMDFRWRAPGSGQVIYNADHWESVAEARQIYAKLNPPKPPEPVVIRPEVKLPKRDLQKLVAGKGSFVSFRDAIVDAEPADGLPKPGPWTFTVNDLKWPMNLCLNLAEHARMEREYSQTKYTFLWSRLTAETQAALQTKDAEMNSTNQMSHIYVAGPELDALINNLNQVIQGDSIYETNAFSQFRLSGDTLKLLAEKPTGPARTQLNRLLLEDEFPKDFVRQPKIIADPASKLRALVMFRMDFGTTTFADVSLIGEDGTTLWTATVNPRIIEPESSMAGEMSGLEGIWDVQFEDHDILVRFNGPSTVELELKTGNMQVMPHF